MAEHPRLDEGQSIQEARRPVVSTAINQQKPEKSKLSEINDLLGIVAPAVGALAEQGINSKSQREVTKATNEAKKVTATMPSPDDLEKMAEWRLAMDENPVLLALNPYAQQKARVDIARVSARSFESELLEMVETIGSDISAEEDFKSISQSINQMREEKLEALGITDPNEIAGFNTEFNQMEQDFTARFNAKTASLKKRAGQERMTTLMNVAMGNLEPSLGGDLNSTVKHVGALLTAESETAYIGGFFNKEERNPLVASNVFDAIVRQHEAHDTGLEILDAGLLDNVHLSLGPNDSFTLAEYQNGKFHDRLRDTLMEMSAQKNAMAQREIEANRKQVQQEDRDAMYDIAQLPASEQYEAFLAIRARASTDDTRELMGHDYPSKLQPWLKGYLDIREDSEEHGTITGFRTDFFQENIADRLDDVNSNINETLQIAFENGTLPAGELTLIQLEKEVRDAATKLSVIAPARKEMRDFHKISMLGQDPTLPDALAKLDAGTWAKSSLITDPNLYSMNTDILAEFDRTMIDIVANEQLDEDGKTIAVTTARQHAMKRFGQLHGHNIDVSQEAADKKAEGEIKVTNLLQQEEPVSANDLASLNPTQRDAVLRAERTTKKLAVYMPDLSPQSIVAVQDGMEAMSNHPAVTGLFTMADFTPLVAVTEIIQDYVVRHSLNDAEPEAEATRLEVQRDTTLDILEAAGQVVTNLEQLEKLDYHTTPQELTKFTANAYQAKVDIQRTQRDYNEVVVKGESSRRFYGKILVETAKKMRKAGGTDNQAAAVRIDKAAIAQGQLEWVLRQSRDTQFVDWEGLHEPQTPPLPKELHKFLIDNDLTNKTWLIMSQDQTTFRIRPQTKYRVEALQDINSVGLDELMMYHESQLILQEEEMETHDRARQESTEADFAPTKESLRVRTPDELEEGTPPSERLRKQQHDEFLRNQ